MESYEVVKDFVCDVDDWDAALVFLFGEGGQVQVSLLDDCGFIKSR